MVGTPDQNKGHQEQRRDTIHATPPNPGVKAVTPLPADSQIYIKYTIEFLSEPSA
jgi:hypothetical protein